jgi:hypothetical protein
MVGQPIITTGPTFKVGPYIKKTGQALLALLQDDDDFYLDVACGPQPHRGFAFALAEQGFS